MHTQAPPVMAGCDDRHDESLVEAQCRNLFFRLCHCLLSYGELRQRRIPVTGNKPMCFVVVVYVDNLKY